MDINPSYQMSPEIALYLQKLQEQKNRMVNPDYMAREDDRGDQGTFSAPSGIAALGQAFSQLGTISGKSSDTGALQANAAALNQQAAQDKKMDLARQDARDKQTGLQLSVLQHLNDKQLASQEAANRLKADQDFKLQQADAERQFRADQASKDRELKSQLAEESNSVRKDLAAAQKPKVTADEHTAAYHASRAEDAADLLGQIEKSGYDPSDYGRAARSFKIPFLDAKPLQSQADRAYKQAQEEFIASVLRKESGAAVSPQEFDRYSTIYFPSPGDSKQVIQQKSIARDRAVENLKGMAGAAYDPSKRTPFAYKPEVESGTAMAAPAAPAKIRVRSPNGKVGSIPAEDLQDALKEGYQEIK